MEICVLKSFLCTVCTLCSVHMYTGTDLLRFQIKCTDVHVQTHKLDIQAKTYLETDNQIKKTSHSETVMKTINGDF